MKLYISKSNLKYLFSNWLGIMAIDYGESNKRYLASWVFIVRFRTLSNYIYTHPTTGSFQKQYFAETYLLTAFYFTIYVVFSLFSTL